MPRQWMSPVNAGLWHLNGPHTSLAIAAGSASEDARRTLGHCCGAAARRAW